MIHVALETSSRPPSLAVQVGEQVRTAALGESRRHASDLLPTLSGLLEEQGVAPRDVELVSVGIGPGSYTGLRVGIATALGLARGAEAPVVSIPSVAAMAYGALEVGLAMAIALAAIGSLRGKPYRCQPSPARRVTRQCAALATLRLPSSPEVRQTENASRA